MLKLVCGPWRGKQVSLPSQETTRPAPARTRQALFNILSHQGLPRQKRVLDLFAGSGVLGMESLSLGACAVTFVEKDPAVLAHLHKNLAQLKTEATITVAPIDTHHLERLPVAAQSPYDLVFVDAPFQKGLTCGALKSLIKTNLLNPETLVIVQLQKTESLDQIPQSYQQTQERIYGQGRFLFLKKMCQAQV